MHAPLREILGGLDAFKARLDGFRPLPAAVVRNLHEDLVVRWTYHSNAIEGNTLTLMETRVVLEGITVGGKLLREHLEVVNHRQAILYMEALAVRGEGVTEWSVRNLHALVLKGIDDDNAGRYRTVNVIIAGARHLPPDFLHVPGEMTELVAWHAGPGQGLHPVERAARLHGRFVAIHPFSDGNGRTARLLMNLELLGAGFPAVVMPVEKRLRYYETLDHAHTQGDYEPFIALVTECVQEGFQPYWHALGLE